MSAILEHLGHQIVVYPFHAVEHIESSNGLEGFSVETVFRYLIDGRAESGLCHPSYAEALAAARLDVEMFHGYEVPKKESA